MEQVIANMKEPAWWFSTVIVSLLIGIVAPFAKDFLTSVFSKTSVRLRERNEKKKQLQAEVINALAENESYLIMYFIRASMMTILTIFMVAFFVIGRAIFMFSEAWCGVHSSSSMCNEITPMLNWFVTIFAVFTIISSGYSSSKATRTAMRSLSKYRKNKGLPWIR